MSTQLHLPFRKDVQGLRGLAVLLVIAAHSGLTPLAGGFIGVDIFFVISGYLITGLLYKEAASTGSIRLVDFFARRVRRLVPALLVMVLASLILAMVFLHPAAFVQQTASAPFALTWTSNFYFNFRTQDYFAELTQFDLYLHTWSLGVEEQFYILWPLLFLLVLYLTRAPGSDRVQTLAIRSLAIISVFSFGLCLYLAHTFPLTAFYQMPSRAWQFALGGLAFLVFSPNGTLAPRFAGLLGQASMRGLFFLGLGLIALASATLGAASTYPGLAALIPTIGAVFLLVSGLGQGSGESVLSNRIMVWLGDRSYSLYLWHWPVFSILHGSALVDSEVALLVGLLVTFIAASLSYTLVELPFWKGRFRGEIDRRTIGAGLASSLGAVAISVGLLAAGQQFQQNAPQLAANSRADWPVIYTMDCDTWYYSAELTPCEFTASEHADRTAVFLGDSIGLQWFPVVDWVFSENWRIVVQTKSACPIADVDVFYERIGAVYDVCSEWRDSVIDWVVETKPDLLIIGSSATYSIAVNDWIEAKSRVLGQLSEATGEIVLVAGTPGLGFDGPNCVDQQSSRFALTSGSSCHSTSNLEFPLETTRLLREASDRFDNVGVITMNDLICPNGVCRAMDGDLLVFRDSQHLSASYVQRLAPVFRDRLKEAAPQFSAMQDQN